MDKKNINEHIANFLDYYVGLHDPRYAVMLTGSWGCGKTHFIKQWKKNLEKGIKDPKRKLSSPIYISLFGLTTIQEINEAVTKEIYPILKSKLYKGGKMVLNAVSKVSLNCDLSPLLKSNSNNNPNELDIELDLVSLFKSDSNKARNNRIIIFDDFERCKVDVADMLGYINQFVEHSNVRIIIICNEAEALADKTSDYDRFKEKLIGRTFEVKPNIESAICEFCNKPGVFKFDKRRQRIIKEMFEKVGYNNLRPLYQALQDITSVIYGVGLTSEDENQREFLDRLLMQYVVAYCEYASNEGVRKLAANGHPRGYIYLNNNAEEKELLSKYENMASLDPPYWIWGKPMGHILDSICTGEEVTGKINDYLHKKEEEAPLYRRISQYYLLENKDFTQTYAEALKYIKDSASGIDAVISILSFLITIDKNGIQPLAGDTIETVKENISTIISRYDNLEEFGEYKKLHIDGIIQELRFTDDADPRLKELGNDIEEIAKEKYKELERNEITKLNMLNNTNFKDVTSLYFQQEGTGMVITPKYGDVPFFDVIDPLLFVGSLCKLSNENRVRFRNFMNDRTKKIDPSNGLFFAECENLLIISKELKTLASSKESVEKFSIEKLSQAFEAASEIFKGTV